MDTSEVITSVQEWFDTYSLRVFITLAVAGTYFLVDRIARPRIRKSVGESRFNNSVATKAVRTARVILIVVSLLIIALVWGVGFSSVFVVAGTTLTLVGVALFASWSLLSNITSYFILLLHPQYRRGAYIRIIDADNFIEGYIADIALFHTRLITSSRETVVYPNNLLLTKPSIVNPRARYSSAGKLPTEAQPDDKRFKRRTKN